MRERERERERGHQRSRKSPGGHKIKHARLFPIFLQTAAENGDATVSLNGRGGEWRGRGGEERGRKRRCQKIYITRSPFYPPSLTLPLHPHWLVVVVVVVVVGSLIISKAS